MTQFVNQGLVDELSKSKIFPVEVVKDRKKLFSKKVESWQDAVKAIEKIFYLEWPPCSPQKPKFCYDSFCQPRAS